MATILLRFPRRDPHRLSAEGKDNQEAILQRVIGQIRCSIEGGTVSFPKNAFPPPVHSSRILVPKLNDLRYESSNCFLFSNLKKMLEGKRFASKQEVISVT